METKKTKETTADKEELERVHKEQVVLDFSFYESVIVIVRQSVMIKQGS